MEEGDDQTPLNLMNDNTSDEEARPKRKGPGSTSATKTNEAMINHLSKEIETMSTNTMNSRNRISFSLWVGPFLLLGSLIVGSEKGGYKLHDPGWFAWFVMISAAVLFFLIIAYIIGQVEEGAWEQCNEWRECMVKIQCGEKVTPEDYDRLFIYRELAEKVWWVYLAVFGISFVLIGAVIYFISQALDFSGPTIK